MTTTVLLIDYETSILDRLKEAASLLFSELKNLTPEKEVEQKLDIELAKALETYNQFSSVLGALYGIIDAKVSRLEASLEGVKFGNQKLNSEEVLTNYWEIFSALIEAYITLVDSALDEIEQAENKRTVLTELHSSLLFLRKQLVQVFKKTEDLIEMISVHDALTEVNH